MEMSAPAAGLAAAERLLHSRRYAEALAALDERAGSAETLRLRRRVLARLGRHGEAAEAGGRLLASGAGTAEDRFRQAQILVECGAWAEALDAALAAWDATGPDHRLVAPLAQAALADAALARRLPGDGREDGTLAPPVPVPGRIFVPQRLPHYAALDADHPGTMGMLHRVPGLDLHEPAAPDGGWLGRLRTAVEAARPVVDALTGLHPLITRDAAARYLGGRLVAALPDAAGASFDFLTNTPLTVGQRPFVLWYDVLPTLFQPFAPFDDADISADASPLYWIVRAFLESDRCVGLITHYPVDGNPLDRFFGSPAIRRKLVYVNPREVETAGPAAPARQDRPPRRLLFTSSRNHTDEGFYYRGGVDVLCAFLDLAEEWVTLELILRTPLPATLGTELRRRIETHPRVRWLPDPMPAEAYSALVASADLFVMPAGVLYRNGVIHAMKEGLVPVVPDVLGMADLVRHDHSGVIVSGRARMLQLGDDPPSVRQDLTDLLRATEAPCDPVFFTAFKDALRSILTDPAAARLGRAARTAVAGWSGQRDLEALGACLRQASELAELQARHGEPVRLPRQGGIARPGRHA